MQSHCHLGSHKLPWEPRQWHPYLAIFGYWDLGSCEVLKIWVAIFWILSDFTKSKMVMLCWAWKKRLKILEEIKWYLYHFIITPLLVWSSLRLSSNEVLVEEENSSFLVTRGCYAATSLVTGRAAAGRQQGHASGGGSCGWLSFFSSSGGYCHHLSSQMMHDTRASVPLILSRLCVQKS